MNLAIDISQIVFETGVSEYTKKLIENLINIDKKNNYILFGGSLRKFKSLIDFGKQIDKSVKTKFYRIPPFVQDIIFNKFHKFDFNYFLNADVIHTSDWVEMYSSSAKVTTVHDLSPILFPNFTSKKIVDVHKRKLQLVKNESECIIVPSQSTREDLLKLGFDDKKIYVIPEAPSEVYIDYKAKPEDYSMLNDIGINFPYLLAVGANARKNIKNIIKAFKLLKNIDLKLVVTGNYDKEEFQNTNNTIFLGHVDKKYMPLLYANAQALVYVSLYEGFGLPVLDAYSIGCPVVTSNTSSLKEISYGAAAVNPQEPEDIKKGILKVLSNKKNYITRGKHFVKKFSWRKTAEETLKVYNIAYSRKK